MSLHPAIPTVPPAPRAPPASPDPAPPAIPPDDPRGARGALTLGWLTAALLIAATLGWGLLAAIDGAIIAPGRIEAARTRIVVQHPEGGRVAELMVSDGATVAAGAALLSLDPGGLATERAIVEAQFAEALARTARHEAERDGLPEPVVTGALAAELARPGATVAVPLEGQRRLMAARAEALAHQREQLARRRAQAEAQRAGLAAQIDALAAEVRAQADELARHEALREAGLIAAPQATALRREALRLEGALAAARAEAAAAAGRVAEIDQQMAGLHASRREEAEAALRDLGPVLLELAARRGALDDRLDRLTLRAPVAGRVHGLAPAGPGAVLRPAEPVAEIVPEGTGLHVAAQIRPDDIDRLHPGQPVRVLLPATGGRARPELPGRIALISAEAVENPRSGERLFRAEIALDPEGLDALQGRALLAGLPVEVQVRTGSRSPLGWLMAPLRVYFDRALRED
jgi:HlyD family secretion protein